MDIESEMIAVMYSVHKHKIVNSNLQLELVCARLATAQVKLLFYAVHRQVHLVKHTSLA